MNEGSSYVFLLSHSHELTGVDDLKLIGIYRTEADAVEARNRLARQPGFRDLPDGFEISEFTLGKDAWAEGFVTVK